MHRPGILMVGGVALLVACAGGDAALDVPVSPDGWDAMTGDRDPGVGGRDDGVPRDTTPDPDQGFEPDARSDLGDPGPIDAAVDDPGMDGFGDDVADVPPPDQVLGLPLRMDGVLYAGAAAVDITPVLDPEHPVWMGGFSQGRAATGVHDPLWARALVLSRDREYAAFVVTDLIGLTAWRIDRMRAALAAQGFAFDRVMVQATHNHNSPDTLGVWGPDRATSGVDPAYQVRVEEAVVEAVRTACAAAVPARLRVASGAVSDLSPYLSSPRFGGKHPQHARTQGLITDSRDPLVMDDTVTAVGLFAADDGATIATAAHVNNHVEVSQGGTLLSSDFAHPLRELLEARFGGVAMLWLGAQGGLQTTWNIRFPDVDDEGGIVWATCDADAVADPQDGGCHGLQEGVVRVDPDGDPVPTWSSDDRWRRVEVYGRLLGRLAADALDAAPDVQDPVLWLRHVRHLLPVQNRLLEILSTELDPSILDPLIGLVRTLYPDEPGLEEYVLLLQRMFGAVIVDTDPTTLRDGPDCPEVATEGVVGCMASSQWLWRLGPAAFLTGPGEVFPEWWHGRPADAGDEWDVQGLRGPESKYFPRATAACADVSWQECRETISVGACQCLTMHAAPYPDPAVPPVAIVGALPGVTFPRVLGVTGDMTGYMVPPEDWTRIPLRPIEDMFGLGYVMETVAFLQGMREHYEESVALGPAVVQRVEAGLATMVVP